MKISEQIRQDTIDYSVNAIKHICGVIGPREAGSEAEQATQEYLSKDIMDNGWADELKVQSFQVAPKAFMGFSRIIPIMILGALISYWFLPWAPLVLCSLGLALFFVQFGFYCEFLDAVYPKATSHNYIATKKATGEVKKRIILSGHIDSAYEWIIFNKFGHVVHIGSLVYCVIGVVISIGLSIASMVLQAKGLLTNDLKLYFLIGMLVFIPGHICLFLYSNYKRVVPGANDNLTGCLASAGVLKALKEQGITYENTEVVCLLMGSEEAGLRGAKAYCKEFEAQIKADKEAGIETIFVGLETFRDIEHMSIYTRDMSGLIAADKGVATLLDEAAKPFSDKPLPHASVWIGASDGAAMQQGGIPSCTLASMDPTPASYYHTRNDTPEILVPECMMLGLNIAIEAVEIFDRQGAKK
ncbi:MAG: M20/M25/M40 family metallo-hydrolase [Bacillota bacterium]